MYKNRKGEKMPKICQFFKTRALKLQYLRLQNFFKHSFLYEIGAQLELSLGKKNKYRKRDRAKKPFKIAPISNINKLL